MSRVFNNRGFVGFVTGIQQVMRNPTVEQNLRNDFRVFNRTGNQQNRPPFLMQLFGQLDRFNQLFASRQIDARLMIFTNVFAVSRNLDDFHLIDINKLIGSNAGSPRHSSNVIKQPKQALIGN